MEYEDGVLNSIGNEFKLRLVLCFVIFFGKFRNNYLMFRRYAVEVLEIIFKN